MAERNKIRIPLFPSSKSYNFTNSLTHRYQRSCGARQNKVKNIIYKYYYDGPLENWSPWASCKLSKHTFIPTATIFLVLVATHFKFTGHKPDRVHSAPDPNRKTNRTVETQFIYIRTVSINHILNGPI